MGKRKHEDMVNGAADPLTSALNASYLSNTVLKQALKVRRDFDKRRATRREPGTGPQKRLVKRFTM